MKHRNQSWPLHLQAGCHKRRLNLALVFMAALFNRAIILVHGQVTIIFVVSVCLSVCLFVQSFPQPSSIRFGSN